MAEVLDMAAELPPISEHEPLARFTSWRIGGPARFYAAAHTAGQLAALATWASQRELPLLVLGGGTNMLISDAGFPGLVVRLRDQSYQIDAGPHGPLLRVAAGAPMAGTARRVTAEGYRGLQWAEGLPGTIGGAVFGNAGCYGGDIAGGLRRAWLLVAGQLVAWSAAELGFGYRTSALKRAAAQRPAAGPPGPLVVAAELALTPDDPARLRDEMEAIAASRRGRTPSGSSCGSVFKNPPGDAAGRLIEAAGLKGARSGAAIISDRHANYIVNQGGATAADVQRLMAIAQAAVRDRLGVELEPEVQLVGFAAAALAQEGAQHG